MRNLCEELKSFGPKSLMALAEELWRYYEEDGEYGIADALDVDVESVQFMLDCAPGDINYPMDLYTAMRIYKDDDIPWEAVCRSKLRELRRIEAYWEEELRKIEEAKAKAKA